MNGTHPPVNGAAATAAAGAQHTELMVTLDLILATLQEILVKLTQPPMTIYGPGPAYPIATTGAQHPGSTRDEAELVELLSLTVKTLREYLRDAKRDEKQQQQDLAWDLWLNCRTPEAIAERSDIEYDSRTIRNWIEKIQSVGNFQDPPESRQHFDVWSFPKADGESSYFGKLPPQVVENRRLRRPRRPPRTPLAHRSRIRPRRHHRRHHAHTGDPVTSIAAALVRRMQPWQITHAIADEYIREMCDRPGVLLMYIRDSRRTNTTGWPDYTICGRRLLFREFKTLAAPKLSPEQKQWRDYLRAAGMDWALWTPADLTSGQIDNEIEEIT